MAVAEVADAEHEAELAIPLRDDRGPAEHEGLGSLLGLGHLDEHAADEERVDDGTQQRLEEEEHDALRAALGNVAVPVADGGFGLYEEEEGGGKVVHVGHARAVGVIVRPVQVPSQVGDAPPHRSHDQPGDRVGQQEDEQVPAPLEVHQRGEEVGQVTAALAAQVAVLHVAAPVLVHEALPLSAGTTAGWAHRLVLIPKLPAHRSHAAEPFGGPRGSAGIPTELQPAGEAAQPAGEPERWAAAGRSGARCRWPGAGSLRPVGSGGQRGVARRERGAERRSQVGQELAAVVWSKPFAAGASLVALPKSQLAVAPR